MVRGIEETFAVEAIAGILAAVIQDDAETRNSPFGFGGGEGDDLHYVFWLMMT